MDCECFYFHKSNLKRITAWEGSQRKGGGQRLLGLRAGAACLRKYHFLKSSIYISVIANVFVIKIRKGWPKLVLAHVVYLSN